MKRFFFFIIMAVLAFPALAQLNGNGFYRVQNYKSNRYIILVDNKADKVNMVATDPDLLALRTIKPISKVISDPGSIYYIQNAGGSQYNLLSQGCDAHAFAGRYLNITKASNVPTYYAWGEASGIRVFLYDESGNASDGVLMKSGNEDYRNWKILPVSASSDNYFGLKPDVTVAGLNYSSIFASFGFTMNSSAMKAYAVTKVDDNIAVYQEVTGQIAPSTPVFVLCAGANPSDNRLELYPSGGNKPSANMLRGVYFNTNEFVSAEPIKATDFHYNATPYDPNTMRLLGVTSEGKLGYVKSNVTTIPKNKAYLVVPAGTPDELTLMTQAEYEAYLAADVVTVTADNKTKVYGDELPALTYTVSGTGTLKGQPLLSTTATASSAVGQYAITVERGTVTNRQFTPVNGTLAVSKAMLTIKAQSYTIKQNEALPTFAADITGFKLGQTASILSAQPQLVCNVPDDKTPGEYEITVSGAQAQNYDFTYTAGKLTILPADPITITANSVQRTYGEENPEFSYTVSGGVITGSPIVTCEANKLSPVGDYDITIEAGSISYPNLTLVPGKLTVNKATLTATAQSYTITQDDQLPEYQVILSGFRNDDDASCITTMPEASCILPETNPVPVGTYTIMVQGGEAQNYLFNYVNGQLTVIIGSSISSNTILQAPVDVYSLTGRLLLRQVRTLDSLPSGMYIIQGRKVVVR